MVKKLCSNAIPLSGYSKILHKQLSTYVDFIAKVPFGKGKWEAKEANPLLTCWRQEIFTQNKRA